jgi:GTP-binding protein HflX
LGDPKRESLKVSSQRAVLAGVFHPDDGFDRTNALDELKGLVQTAGVEVVGELVQFRETPTPSTCIGSGKLEELKQMILATEAQMVIFDNNLSPSQGRALEQALEKPIVDRSEVILDIFATHARTTEAMLQVELAQLMYYRTRLKRMWTHLERVGGGGTGGLGAGRGPGEKQLETDRRLIDRRIAELKSRLHDVEERRSRTVSLRREQPTVSLVGYTNAGKSTLMRALTGADVLVEDKLFATLDTRTRRWHVAAFGDVLLSDTVGFVRNLPHHLVASFRSTLEEARHADLLLHVVDRVQDQSFVDVLRRRYGDTVTISAAQGLGLDRLHEVVGLRLSGGFVEAEIETGVGNGRLFAWLTQHAAEHSRTYIDDAASRVKIACRLPKQAVGSMPQEDAVVRLQS